MEITLEAVPEYSKWPAFVFTALMAAAICAVIITAVCQSSTRRQDTMAFIGAGGALFLGLFILSAGNWVPRTVAAEYPSTIAAVFEQQHGVRVEFPDEEAARNVVCYDGFFYDDGLARVSVEDNGPLSRTTLVLEGKQNGDGTCTYLLHPDAS